MIDPFDPNLYTELSKYPMPQITKDGVTVAKSISKLSNPLQNIGSKLLIDAADRTNEESGDGTTTCTVIARAILKKGQMYLIATPQGNISEFRNGIRDAVGLVIKELERMSIKVENVEQVFQIAMVSSNNDVEIANILTQIYNQNYMAMHAVSIGNTDQTFKTKPHLEFL